MSSVSSWTPSQEDLSQLLQLLRDSQSPNNAVQQQVQQRLDTFHKIPDYNNYLLYILTQCTQEDPGTRTVAGLMLKNNVRAHFLDVPPAVLDHIKQSCLTGLADPNPMIRSTLGIVISAIVKRAGLASWPGIVPKLLEGIDQQQFDAVDGAFNTLQKVCEDVTGELDKYPDGGQLVGFLIMRCIQFFDSQHTKFRVYALTCMNQFVLCRSPHLLAHIDTYIAGLFKLATDESSDVRQLVCQALVWLLDVRPDKLVPHMSSLIEYMLFCTQDVDESVAIEACEFWLAVVEHNELLEHVRPYLGRIVPLLLKGMIYSEMDLITMGEDDDTVPDSEQDIKPRHHRAKTHEQPHADSTGHQAVPSHPAHVSTVEDDVETDEESDTEDDGNDDDDYSEWNIRKCSAAALDVFSGILGEEILPHLLDPLKAALFENNWRIRESGILALGAIAAGGCASGISPHLPDLVPWLVDQLSHPKALVRSIACWTLSRYASWYIAEAEQNRAYLDVAMQGVLKCVLDSNKRVQEAACSALSSIEEEALGHMAPYLEPTLRALAAAFGKYQQKNMIVLYDAIGTLADSVGTTMDKKEYIEVILPPLIDRWNAISDDDRDLFPLLECLSSITAAAGSSFAPYAPPLFERGLKLVSSTLMQSQAHEQNPALDAPDKDFMVVGLDLLDGVAQGLGAQIEPLATNSQPSLLSLISLCLTDSVHEVRQSALAVLGDLAIGCFGYLQPHIHELMPVVVQQIDDQPENVNVSNNATWASGEIALRLGADMTQYIPTLMERMVPLLTNTRIALSLRENCAVALGRLGLTNPTLMALHLEAFAEPWCKVLRNVRDNEEKESAFRGMCAMIQVNPGGIAQSLAMFIDAVVHFRSASAELNDAFGKILRGMKQISGDNWSSFHAAIPPQIQEPLRQRFGL